jgi:hypothetical protein
LLIDSQDFGRIWVGRNSRLFRDSQRLRKRKPMKNRIAKTLSLIALALVALSPFCRAQAQIAGDWLGS